MLRSSFQTLSSRRGLLATSSLLLAAGTALSFTIIAGSSSSKTSTFQPSALRSYQTPADSYYEQHGELPLPSVPHAILSDNNNSNDDDAGNVSSSSGILLVGDVHGCFEELMELHQKAVQANGGKPLRLVILVGDLCNKGPRSLDVIHWCRQNNNNATQWLAVRGNHDNAALSASLGDRRRREKPKYKWVQDLTDDDVVWMAELPYTLRIPKRVCSGLAEDILVVHAGFGPDKALPEQSTKTMTTIRTTTIISNDKENDSNTKQEKEKQEVPWASQWQGPERVVFGHDAIRGLQQYDKATGLDTGCVYGKQLTGLLLPQNQLLSVDAKKEYVSISKGDES